MSPNRGRKWRKVAQELDIKTHSSSIIESSNLTITSSTGLSLDPYIIHLLYFFRTKQSVIMRFTAVVMTMLFTLALAAPAPSAFDDALKIREPEPEAEADPEALLETRACQAGKYRCHNNNAQVCNLGIWMLAAKCNNNQKCVKSNGAAYCI